MGTDPVLAEYLPILYRVALDAVDELARCGRRTEAARLRLAAGRAYSRAWDARCQRVLEDVIVDAYVGTGRDAPTLPLEGVAGPPA
jgi:hypothetical protein